MNYEAFGNQLASGEYARSNLFEVVLYVNNQMDGPGVIPETLRFMIKTASLPGKQLGEVQVKRFGAQFKMANDMIVDTLPMTVICSSDMRSDTGHSADRYRMAYYDDYTTKMTITSLDREGGEVYAVMLDEAWPNNLGQVELSWDNSEVSTFTVTMAFRDWFEVATDG